MLFNMTNIKLRGIYARALTQLFLDEGFFIARSYGDVSIYNRRDGQGVVVEGEKDEVYEVLQVLRQSLPDVVVRNYSSEEQLEIIRKGGEENVSLDELKNRVRIKETTAFDVEFPYNSKLALDDLRRRKVPTLKHHHLLTLIDQDFISRAEGYLPEKSGERLIRELVYDQYEIGKLVGVNNVRLSGEIFRSEGKIVDFSHDELKLKIGESEAKAKLGSRIYSYSTEDGMLIYSVNTPTEFYPGRIRHVDLEVDVIKQPDGKIGIRNQEKLDERVKEGVISKKLANEAMKVALEVRRDVWDL